MCGQLFVQAEGSRHLASVGLGMAGDEGGRLNACTHNIVYKYIYHYICNYACMNDLRCSIFQ
jgi:hypothetical protein